MPSTPFPTLTSKRLILREITQTDIQQIFEIYSDTEAMRWFGTNPVQSSEQAQSIIELFANWRIQANSGTRWGIQLKGEDHLIGTCGLFRWDTNWKKCSVGYELASSAWGNGYMFEALNTIIPWGFTEMMLNRIEALIHPKNVQSLRLIENLSFRNEGLLREAGYWSNQHHDLLQYGLLLSDWNTTKQH